MSMMEDPTDAVEPTRRVSSRRNFMAKIGATALVATAIIVGKASPALATYKCGCCHLAYTSRCPVNWCLLNGDWVWYCGKCTCCEAYWATCSASACC
jgi:hypothetical protein